MIMSDNLPTKPSSRVAAFLEKAKLTPMARLIFALDATMSRQPLWDTACRLQGSMFTEAGKLGALQIQLVYFRGLDECRASHWTNNARDLARIMTGINVKGGYTQIGRILAHIRKENTAQKVSAAIFVGDAMEEDHGALCDAAAALGVPLFLFQEGHRLRGRKNLPRNGPPYQRRLCAFRARRRCQARRAVARRRRVRDWGSHRAG
jgi:hypothetical protein